MYYNAVLNYPDASSTIYQFGIYKLGWTAYLLNEYEHSIALFGYLIRDSERMDELGLRRNANMVKEAVEYLAHDFMEQKSGPPVQLATNFLDYFDNQQVTVDVLTQMGDFYIEQGFWMEAIEAYNALLQRDPYSREAPFIQSRIAIAYEGEGDYASAARAREAIVENYGPQSEWAQNAADSTLFNEVDSLRASALENSIAYYNQQVTEAAGDREVASSAYSVLIDKIEVYLEEFGDSRNAYEFRFLLGDSYYNTGSYARAGDIYLQVSTTAHPPSRGKTPRETLSAPFMKPTLNPVPTASIFAKRCTRSPCTTPTTTPRGSSRRSSSLPMREITTTQTITPLPGSPIPVSTISIPHRLIPPVQQGPRFGLRSGTALFRCRVVVRKGCRRSGHNR